MFNTYGVYRKEFASFLALMLILSAISNVLMLLPTLYMLQIFDRVMVVGNVATLWIISFVFVALYAWLAAADVMRGLIQSKFFSTFEHRIGEIRFRGMIGTSSSQISTQIAKEESGFSNLRKWFTGGTISSFFDLPWIPLYVFVMFLLHPVLGAATIGVIIFLVSYLFLVSRYSSQTAEELQGEEVEVHGFVNRRLVHKDSIDSYGLLPSFKREITDLQNRFILRQARSEATESVFSCAFKQVRFALSSLAIGIGAVLAMSGDITLGAMIAASLIMARATSPIEGILGGWRSTTLAFQALRTLEGQSAFSVNSSSHTKSIERLPNAPLLSLQRVDASVGVGLGKRTLLRDLTFDISDGEVTLIRGASGTGKSTLGRLLVGSLEPSSGLLTRRKALTVGYLPQDLQLFNSTVSENISCFRVANSCDVLLAARMAGVHDIILRVPGGYGASIDTQAACFSGGQLKRLALARAIFSTPSLVVLDEPDANMDENGIEVIYKAVEWLKGIGSSVVIITHREYFDGLADVTMTLAGGVVETGRVIKQ